MKKSTKTLLAVIACVLVFTGCNFGKKPNNDDVIKNNDDKQQEQQQKEEEVKTDPIYADFSFDDAMAGMQSALGDTKLSLLSEDDIEEKYSFEKYKGLQKYAASEVSDKTINEVIMVKLGDIDTQSTDMLLKFVNRLTDLKNEYADNEDIQKILNSQESLVIKQQAGVAVMIISPEASKMEAEFDKFFK